jgi:hypothetical protein
VSNLPEPLAVGLAALVALLAVVGLRLAAHDGDPSIFVLAGDGVTDPADAPGNLHVEPGIRGYDGQAFYRFARNPVTRDRTDDGISLLRPAYRHQRIGYPLLAWAASGGGREAAVPTALVAVNVLAGAALAAVAAALARDAGRSPWWGLVPAGWAGFLVALALDLSEVLAAALLLGALLALRRERWAPATALLVAAALTRETTLLVALAVLAAALLPRLRARVPIVVGVVPLVVDGAWRLALRAWGWPASWPTSPTWTAPGSSSWSWPWPGWSWPPPPCSTGMPAGPTSAWRWPAPWCWCRPRPSGTSTSRSCAGPVTPWCWDGWSPSTAAPPACAGWPS